MWNHNNIHLLTLELMRMAKEEVIAFELHGVGQCIASYCPMTLTFDKTDWLRRKRNTVLRFSMSTQEVYEKHKGDESFFLAKYGLDGKEYTITPGSVPIIDQQGFLRGVITITGKTPLEDHHIASRALEYLKNLNS